MTAADDREALIERLAGMIARGAVVTVGPRRCAAVETFDGEVLRITLRFPRSDWTEYCAREGIPMPEPDKLLMREPRR